YARCFQLDADLARTGRRRRLLAKLEHLRRRPAALVPDGFHVLQRAGEGAAVEQQVLPGDVAGMRTAQERAGIAELLRRAEAPGRIDLGALGHDLLDRNAALLGFRLAGRAQAIGIER